MKENKDPYENYIIVWNSNSDFQESGTLSEALANIQDLIDNDGVPANDITLYACKEIPIDVTIQSKVKVRK